MLIERKGCGDQTPRASLGKAFWSLGRPNGDMLFNDFYCYYFDKVQSCRLPPRSRVVPSLMECWSGPAYKELPCLISDILRTQHRQKTHVTAKQKK